MATIGQATILDTSATKLLVALLTNKETAAQLLAEHPVLLGIMRDAMVNAMEGANIGGVDWADVDVSGIVAAATAEGSLPADSSLSFNLQSPIAPSRQAVSLLSSDTEQHRSPVLTALQQVAGLQGNPPVRMAPSMLATIGIVNVAAINAIKRYLWSAYCAGLAAASASIGTSGLNVTFAQLRAGIDARRDAGARGIGLGLTHRKAWTAVQTEQLSAGGALANSQTVLQTMTDRRRIDTIYPGWYSGVDMAVAPEGLSVVGPDTIGGIAFEGAFKLSIENPMPSGERTVILRTPIYTIYQVAYAGGSQQRYEIVFHASLTCLHEAARAKIVSVT